MDKLAFISSPFDWKYNNIKEAVRITKLISNITEGENSGFLTYKDGKKHTKVAYIVTQLYLPQFIDIEDKHLVKEMNDIILKKSDILIIVPDKKGVLHTNMLNNMQYFLTENKPVYLFIEEYSNINIISKHRLCKLSPSILKAMIDAKTRKHQYIEKEEECRNCKKIDFKKNFKYGVCEECKKKLMGLI